MAVIKVTAETTVKPNLGHNWEWDSKTTKISIDGEYEIFWKKLVDVIFPSDNDLICNIFESFNLLVITWKD